jgi:hypothetical protein
MRSAVRSRCIGHEFVLTVCKKSGPCGLRRSRFEEHGAAEGEGHGSRLGVLMVIVSPVIRSCTVTSACGCSDEGGPQVSPDSAANPQSAEGSFAVASGAAPLFPDSVHYSVD